MAATLVAEREPLSSTGCTVPSVAAQSRGRLVLLVVLLAGVPGEPAGKSSTAEFGGDDPAATHAWFIAFRDDVYPVLVREVTAERVKQHFTGICHGDVERFELPNLGALNFLLHESLGGGGTLSLMTDAQGKTFSTALLRMEIDIPDDEAHAILTS